MFSPLVITDWLFVDALMLMLMFSIPDAVAMRRCHHDGDHREEKNSVSRDKSSSAT